MPLSKVHVLVRLLSGSSDESMVMVVVKPPVKWAGAGNTAVAQTTKASKTISPRRGEKVLDMGNLLLFVIRNS